MRLRKKHLPHRIVVKHFMGESAEGATYSSPISDVAAYVEQKSKLVVDRRSSSPTAGTEIVSRSFVVLLPSDDVLPGSLITVWPGTPREREAEVIDSAFFDYKNTPNHVELYLT